MFQHTAQELSQVAEQALALAKQKGATSAEVDVSESIGQSVQVRWRDIEQIEHQQDKSLDVTVYVGHSKGRASTADLSPQALAATVQAACDIARYTAEDPFSGLADPDLMAKHIGDLDRYHEWDLSSETAVELAKRCEDIALSADKRITNSEGAGVSTGHFQFVYANSHGFNQHQRGTRLAFLAAWLPAMTTAWNAIIGTTYLAMPPHWTHPNKSAKWQRNAHSVA